MKILVIADYYPMPDRSSGDLRFFTSLKILGDKYQMVYCAYDEAAQRLEVGGSAERQLVFIKSWNEWAEG
ncbi:MAG: hypothetical protein ACQ9ET_05530, partial [Nitrosomonadaceae bacterium]